MFQSFSQQGKMGKMRNFKMLERCWLTDVDVQVKCSTWNKAVLVDRLNVAKQQEEYYFPTKLKKALDVQGNGGY